MTASPETTDFTTILLQELTNADLDWLLAAGKHRQIAPGHGLIKPHQSAEFLYILLEGELNLVAPPKEILRLYPGEMIGAIPYLESYLLPTLVRAQTTAWVLEIHRDLLHQKLTEDLEFAANFYRACALLQSDRLAQLSDRLVEQQGEEALFTQPAREVVTLFAELQDQDIDWLIAVGEVHHLKVHQVLVAGGRSPDALHILLDGVLRLGMPEVASSPVAAAFPLPGSEKPLPEFARLSRGDLLGEMQWLNPMALGAEAVALRETQVLSIPRWRLATKLIHDAGFATRFYRVLAVLLADQQQIMVEKLGYPSAQSQSLDSQFLTRVALAEARFEWMLKRIQTKIVTGRLVQW